MRYSAILSIGKMRCDSRGSLRRRMVWLEPPKCSKMHLTSSRKISQMRLKILSDFSRLRYSYLFRMLFDWLVTGHVIDSNPAHSVPGPRYTVKKGKTPVLTHKPLQLPPHLPQTSKPRPP